MMLLFLPVEVEGRASDMIRDRYGHVFLLGAANGPSGVLAM